MRSKKFFISLLSFILIFLITSTIVSQRKMRAYDFIPPEGSFVVSKKQTQIVPGVVETEVIYNTPDGQNPVSGFLVDINLGSSVNIMVALKTMIKEELKRLEKWQLLLKQKLEET